MGRLATLIALLTPALALACPMCTSTMSKESAAAYAIASVFISLSPLLMIGGIVAVLVYRSRKQQRLEAQQDASASPLLSKPADGRTSG